MEIRTMEEMELNPGTGQPSGNDQPSGNTTQEAPKEAPKKRKRTPKTEPEQVTETLKGISSLLTSLQTELTKALDVAFDKRMKVKMTTLEHFFNKAINMQMCEKDRKRLDRAIEEAQYVLKRELARLSKEK
jgi:hypothetical protein